MDQNNKLNTTSICQRKELKLALPFQILKIQNYMMKEVKKKANRPYETGISHKTEYR